MIAAIYARKSHEEVGVGDDAKSVTRQIEHARAYAERKGWTVAPEHVYTDDGISGAEFGAQRPGLAALLNALSPRRFDVLIMSEESRLGREQFQVGYLLSQFLTAGVKIHYYLEAREVQLGDATGKFLEQVRATSPPRWSARGPASARPMPCSAKPRPGTSPAIGCSGTPMWKSSLPMADART